VSEEILKILEMNKSGQVSAEQAAELIKALGDSEKSENKPKDCIRQLAEFTALY